MSEEVEALRAEVAALRAEMAEGTRSGEQAVSRRRLLTGVAALGAFGAASVAKAPSASANDGDNLVIGQTNTASNPTDLVVEDASPDHTFRVAMQDSDDPISYPTPSNPALLAESKFTGVTAFGRFIGVLAATDTGTAVVADAQTDGGLALFARSVRGPAGWFESGDGVAVRLVPTDSSGHPDSGHTYEAGSLSIDDAGDVWLCTNGGDPGTWTRLLRQDTATGRVIPITPFRALDTRAAGGRATGAPAVPGQRSGPLRGGTSVTLDLAGVAPIPATASGVVGNATVLTPDGNGFLRIMPAGASIPASTFNFYDGTTVANGFTSGLSSTGLRAVAPVSSTVRYHLVIDIAAYIT